MSPKSRPRTRRTTCPVPSYQPIYSTIDGFKKEIIGFFFKARSILFPHVVVSWVSRLNSALHALLLAVTKRGAAESDRTHLARCGGRRARCRPAGRGPWSGRCRGAPWRRSGVWGRRRRRRRRGSARRRSGPRSGTYSAQPPCWPRGKNSSPPAAPNPSPALRRRGCGRDEGLGSEMLRAAVAGEAKARGLGRGSEWVGPLCRFFFPLSFFQTLTL